MFPFFHGSDQPEQQYSETEHRIAAHLERHQIDVISYPPQDLYFDLSTVNLEPPLSKPETEDLMISLRGIVEERFLLQSFMPFYRTYRTKIMALNLARYALLVDDIFTAYYAADYAFRPAFGQPDPASKVQSEIITTWNKWIANISDQS